MVLDSMPPLPSLRLLIPPLRLMTAFMWHVAEEQKLEHYEKLENFVSLVTKMVPDLLNHRQRATLLIGLRAKMLLEMCRGDLPVDSQTVKTHLHQIQSSLPKPRQSEMDILQSNLLSLILELLEDPVKKEKFFQRVYPVKYGPDFDKALRILVCFFISRLEQLLPKPNFKQVASWMNSPSLWAECEQYLSQTQDLQRLLKDHCHRSLENNGLPSGVEDRIIDSLSLSATATTGHSQNDTQSEPCLDAQSSSSQSTHQAKQKIQGLLQNCQEVDTTSGVGKAEQRQCDIEDDDDDDEHDVGAELDLSEYGVREKEVTADTSVSDFAHTLDTPRGTPPTASENFDMEDIAVEKLALPDTSGLNHGETLPGGVLMDTTVPSEFCSTSPVNGRDQTVQEILVGAHPGNRMNLIASLTVPSQTTAQQTTLLVPSDTSNDQDDRNEEELSQGVADSQVVFDSTSEGSFSSVPTKSLVSHWAEKKKENKMHISTPHRCSHCGREFEKPSGLSSHKRAHPDCANSSRPSGSQEKPKEPEMTMAPIRQIECRFCGMNTPTAEMYNHLMTHKGIRPYRCKHCDKSFVKRYSLKVHLSKHAGTKSLVCPWAKKKENKTHVSTPHQCSHCGREFEKPSGLSSHKRAHPDCANSSRPSCSQETPKEPGMTMAPKEPEMAMAPKEPEMTTAPIRQRECAFCGKNIPTAEMNNHLMTHKGIKPYLFEKLSGLSSHKRAQKKEKKTHISTPHQCSHCGREFEKLSGLSRHKRAHPDCANSSRPSGSQETPKEPEMTMGPKEPEMTMAPKEPEMTMATKEPEMTMAPKEPEMTMAPKEPEMTTAPIRQRECRFCGMHIPTAEMNNHLMTHKGIRPYRCKHCDKSFVYRYSLKFHLSKHTGTKGLVSHWAEKKKENKTHISTPHRCSHCGREFEKPSGLSSHKRAYPDCANSSPPSCSQETPKEPEMTMGPKEPEMTMAPKEPEMTMAPKEPDMTMAPKEPDMTMAPKKTEMTTAPIRQSECAFCLMNIPTAEMNNHLMTHKGIRPYRCKHCDKSYVARSSLMTHLSNHTGEKPFPCEVCGKSFFYRGSLTAHVKRHYADKKHCCPYCGKLFLARQSLNVHLLVHTGERPYLCSTCGKGSQSAAALQVHERSHTGEKPFKCGVCDRGFVTSSHRLVHTRMHTGERPHSCSVCGRGFSQKGCYKRHMRTHTGDRPYKCTECPKTYIALTHLNKHRQTHKT